MLEVATKDLPEIKKLFPAYRKRKVWIYPSESVRLYQLNWDGGSKREYHAIDIRNPQWKAKSFAHWGNPHPFNNMHEGVTVPLAPGFAIVVVGWFCGKPATMALHLHPQDMPKALPAPA